MNKKCFVDDDVKKNDLFGCFRRKQRKNKMITNSNEKNRNRNKNIEILQ